ncbi:hypothetical protein M569_12498, partial [Genlisea aurea]
SMATTAGPPENDQLPTTTLQPPSKSKKLTLLPLIFMIYFEVSGGPYGEEPTVEAAGPLLAILGFLIFSFLWCIPEALITAELSTTFPGNGGFVVWADRAFGPIFGTLMGTWKFLSTVVNMASLPALSINYLTNSLPVFSTPLWGHVAVLVFVLLCSVVNYVGVVIVGYIAVVLAAVSLAPFALMCLISIPRIRPHRWISLGQKGVKRDWNLYFNTLFWNLNYWDSISTLAGEVEDPNKTLPSAFLWAVILISVSYVLPLVAVTGAVVVDQSEWQTGFMADAAGIISGQWLKVWIEIGAVLSSIGLFQAQLSSCSYQLLGMADLAFLPRVFAAKSKWFDTPWVGISASTLIVLGVSYLSFTNIVSSANFLYSMGMLLEFSSFLWLRWKLPQRIRPYRVPLKLPALIAMCAVPAAFLVFLMAISTKIVVLVGGAMTAGGIGWFALMRVFRWKKWMVFERVHDD